jgi:hypothetical protein
MKFDLIIKDASGANIAAVLAALGADAGGMTATPSQPATPTGDDGPVNLNAPATDKAGMPWDERIHSGNKAVNADGTWRKRRGVDDATVAAIERELTTRMLSTPAMPAPQMPAPVMPQMPMQPPIPAQPPQHYQPPAMPAPQMPAQPVYQPPAMPEPQPVAAPAPQQPAGMDFNTFMQQLSVQMQRRDANGSPLLPAEYLASVANRVGTAYGTQMNSITDLQNHPQMIDYTVQVMRSESRWQ